MRRENIEREQQTYQTQTKTEERLEMNTKTVDRKIKVLQINGRGRAATLLAEKAFLEWSKSRTHDTKNKKAGIRRKGKPGEG